MSDFDKEAERERLREKFARDEEKRADTKRMSELLLKGATMTNRHCDTCGDPIFRHEGREFCATCQSDEAAAAAEEPPAAGDDAETANGEATASGDPTEATSGADDAAGAASLTDAQGQTERTEMDRSPERQTPTQNRTAERRQPAAGDEAPAQSGDPASARASLVRTLSKHATAAEAADDPRVATDHLEAARAAAETLRALDGR